MKLPVVASKKRRRTILILVVAGMLISFGGWGLWDRYRTTHNPNPVIPTETLTYSSDKPDETPPKKACENYTVPATEPRKIELPSLGVAGCIQKVGIDQHNAITAPSNLHVAGWYVDSVVPGEKGISIIDGHAAGRYEEGIFTYIKNLRPNDLIRIQFGDNSWREFTVAQVQSHPADKVMQEIKPLPQTDKQLTLITCSGTYNSKTKTYNERMLVHAALR